MKCREFTAWIEVDGQRVPEFAMMRIGYSVECYIESLPGKVFFSNFASASLTYHCGL